MKRHFIALIIICLSSLSYIAFAEEHTASCMVGNSATDYVQATAYTEKISTGVGGGYVIIVNGSNKPIVSMQICVTAEKCTTRWAADRTHTEEVWSPVTLYNKNTIFTNPIAPNSTRRIECNSVDSYGGRLRNIHVEIGYPACR